MRFLFVILACTLAAFALAFYLVVPANPEVKFWHAVEQRRDQEIAAVRQAQPEQPILFFTGGSSCAFSIDPKIIEESCGMPAFNLGLPVAAEGKYIVHQALERTRAGDILVLCLEPDILAAYQETGKPSRFSLILSVAAGNPSEASGGGTFGMSPAISDYLNFSRPGARFLSTLLAKAAVGRGYRYTIDDIRYRGRLETPVRDPAMQPRGVVEQSRLSADGRTFLQSVVNAARQRRVRLAYAMPWHYTSESSLIACRANRLVLTNDIGTLMPTIEDDYAGAASDPEYFSDSAQHLSEKGAALRSQALAAKLKDWLVRGH